MNDTRLINTLRTFSKDEMKLFEKFAGSPYHNTGKNCQPLLIELQKFYPDFNDVKLSYEYIYSKLHPGRKFNKQVMWNLSSALEKMSEEFIIQETLKKDEFSRYSFLLLGLSSREDPKFYYKKLEEMKKRFDNMEIGEEHNTGMDYFKVKWKYEAIKGVYYQMIDKFSLTGGPIIKRGEYLILSFIQNLTQDLYNIYFMEKRYNYDYEMNLPLEFVKSINFKQILDYLKNKNFEYEWIIEFYFNKIMCLIDEKEESYFFNLKKMFEEKHKKFTFFENSNTISTLTNYSIEKIDQGKENYLNILFEINEFRLKENIIATMGDIFRKTTYIQIINTALAINKTDWVKSFIEDYTLKLKKEYRKSMGSLAGALLHFKLKEYGKVLQNLNNVEFIDVSDKLSVRILSAMSYYELGETELLIHYIDSSKHFISQNDSVEIATKEAYLTFFKYLDKLISFSEHPDKPAFEKLPQSINSDTVLRSGHRKWFIEKIDELEKKLH